MLLLVGLPTFFLEMALGQYAGLSCTKVYARIAPGLRGLGYGMLLVPRLRNFQYAVVMAYSMLYMILSLRATLPWSTCGDFAGDHCYTVTEAELCDDNQVFFQKTCLNGTTFCAANDLEYNALMTGMCVGKNGSYVPFEAVTYRVSASEEYFYKETLNIAIENGHLDTDINSWSKWGNMRWEILGCLALSWLIVCLSLIKGTKSYGKVVYFTTLFPYVVLTVLLGYIATLDGFLDGVEFYIVPRDWDKLADVNVWNDAAGQIFYSLIVAVGSQLLLASYNGFTNNCHRDAVLIGLFNSLTSLYAGFTVFGVIGYMAYQKGADIEDVVTQGPGLAFIVYPEAVALMVAAPFFSFLFFFMLNLLAVSSLCGSWEALVGALMDEFPPLKNKRVIIMIVSTFIAFLCGISMCFDSGLLMFTMMDNRGANAIVLMAFLEVITVTWFYGVDKIMNHIKEMGMTIPRIMQLYWTICWQVVTPLILLAVTFLAWLDFVPDSLEDYTFPPGAQFLGWCLELCAIVLIILVSIGVVIKRYRAGKSIAFIRAGPLMSPTKLWGPRPDSGLQNKSFDASK